MEMYMYYVWNVQNVIILDPIPTLSLFVAQLNRNYNGSNWSGIKWNLFHSLLDAQAEQELLDGKKKKAAEAI